MTRRTDPLGHTTVFSYDVVGSLTKRIDRNGREIDYRYDAARRLTNEKWLSGESVLNSIDTTYDSVGNRLTAKDSTSSLTFTYDALNRIDSQDNNGTVGVPRLVWNAIYDAQGNMSRVQDSFDVVYASQFDLKNHPTTSFLSGGGISPIRVDYGYDHKGVRTSAVRFNDLAGNQKAGRTNWLYNLQGQLTDLSHFNALDTILANYH